MLRLMGGTADMTAVLARLTAAEKAAADADTKAVDADARAANAQQMVRSDRPKLEAVQADTATLAQQQAALAKLATDYQAALTASLADRAALRAMVEALQAKAVAAQVKRVTSASTLALNATVELPVTWSPAFTDANYIALPVLDATGGVVNITTPGLKAGTQTKDGCVVTFRTNVALLSAVSINVVGLRFG